MATDPQTDKPSPMKRILAWVGAASAVIGLCASIAAGFHSWQDHHQQQAELKAQMAVAQEFVDQKQYDSAVRNYADILKAHPLYGPAQDQQLNAAMLRVETFHVIVPDGHTAGDLAGPELDGIMTILNSGLARAKGPQAADIKAHIGWAHWLNWHIAEREFDSAAEDNLRAAIKLDPGNPYANAMLGNWLLQNGGTLDEAVSDFNTAVASGRARPFVRTLQLAALDDEDMPGARAALFKAVDDMRKNGEPLNVAEKDRVHEWCCDAAMSDWKELSEALAAVPPDDALKTYLWLSQTPRGNDPRERAFVEASLLEISGKGPEALEKYLALQKQLAHTNSSLQDSIPGAIARLSHK